MCCKITKKCDVNSILYKKRSTFVSIMNNLCCIGHITRDKIVTPQQTVYMSGGVAFYFSYAISHLPPTVNYKLITKVAEEDIQAAADMASAGINVSTFPSEKTVFFENIYGHDLNERTQRVRAKSDQFRFEEVEGTEADIYHLGTLLSDDFTLDFVRQLHSRGRVSVDAQGFLRKVVGESVEKCDWEDKREWMKHIDIIKVNEMEMYVLTGENDPERAARAIAEWGPREVLVTLGSLGSVILHEGTCISIPAYKPAKMVDATGCGDTFMAGYLYCRVQGIQPLQSAYFAEAMCTSKLAHNGPFSGTIEEIMRIGGRDIVL